MDLARAEKNIRLGWILSALTLVVSVIPMIYLMIAEVVTGEPVEIQLHLFVPWLLPGILGYPVVIAVALLTVSVWRRSRAGAVALLVMYVLGKVVTFPWLYGFSTTLQTWWVVVALLWVPVFIPGIRGTFAYHRLTRATSEGAG